MLMLYTQLAFPNQQWHFVDGGTQYESARKSRLKLTALLRKAFNEASKPEYKIALMDKGMTESEIDTLKSLADRIVNQDLALQNAKKERFIIQHHVVVQAIVFKLPQLSETIFQVEVDCLFVITLNASP